MRKLAFGYSTRCNIRCDHCVATVDSDNRKMDFDLAKELILKLGQAGVGGVSFSAGEPFLYISEIQELIQLCRSAGIYTRIVTNSFWAKSTEEAESLVSELVGAGLCQLRLSFSRWHQKSVARTHVVNAAQSCQKNGLDYFISFITDFSKEDDCYEAFLREQGLKFFPEPVIYSGRADSFARRTILTDYQANCCGMNPYISPDYEMYACCDAGSHFERTNFFYLGNCARESFDQLFVKTETDRLYNVIRHMGLTTIASFLGMKAREIITYNKCELCRELFNSPSIVKQLQNEVALLEAWHR